MSAPPLTGEHISLPILFSSGDVADWFVRLEICGKADGWNVETQALKVPVLLEEETLATLCELLVEDQANIVTVKTKMIEKTWQMGLISLENIHRQN